jgi:hypothetical protein
MERIRTKSGSNGYLEEERKSRKDGRHFFVGRTSLDSLLSQVYRLDCYLLPSDLPVHAEGLDPFDIRPPTPFHHAEYPSAYIYSTSEGHATETTEK